MATMSTSKTKTGSARYRFEIRLKKDGVIIHQESKTFSGKAVGKDWAKRREAELEKDGVIDAYKHKGISILRSGYRLQNSIEVNCRVNLINNGSVQSLWTMLNASGSEVFRLFVTAIGEIGFYMGGAIPIYFGFTYGVSTELKVQYDKVAHTLKLYKDGVLVLTEVGVALQANVQRSMRIGNYQAANPFPLNGTMDYLTVTEI